MAKKIQRLPQMTRQELDNIILVKEEERQQDVRAKQLLEDVEFYDKDNFRFKKKPDTIPECGYGVPPEFEEGGGNFQNPFFHFQNHQ